MGNKKSSNRNYTILSEDDLVLLLNNTSFDKEQIIDWHRGFLKDCPSGRMNREGFVNFYSQLYPNGRAGKFCKQVFKVFDSDNSGFIDFTELMMSISITTMGDLRKKINLAFQLYDIDKNGIVDKKEMERVIEAIYDLLDYDVAKRTGPYLPSERVKFILSKLDKNIDAHLTRDEFIEGCFNDPLMREILVPYA